MSGVLDFFFEFASTYSYPAAMRIGDVARSAGVTVRWRPFLLGPIFKTQGLDTSPFNIYTTKGRYMWRDLERTCEHLGLPFRRPEPSPQNGLLAAREERAQRLRDAGLPTLPSTLGEERATNPFLRCAEPAVVESANKYLGARVSDPVRVFAAIREWKNRG